MVHTAVKSGKVNHVPCTEDIEMITVGHPDAELLKVFLLKQEKQALKELASKHGEPMYHIVRRLILDALDRENESA